MTQRMHMDEAEPFAYREDLAGRVLPTLRDMVGRTLAALAQVR